MKKWGPLGRTGVGSLDAPRASAVVARGRTPRNMFPCATTGDRGRSDPAGGRAPVGKGEGARAEKKTQSKAEVAVGRGEKFGEGAHLATRRARSRARSTPIVRRSGRS